MIIDEFDIDTIELVFYIVISFLFMGIVDFIITCNKLDEEFCEDKEKCTFLTKVKCFFKHRFGINHTD